MPDQFDDDDESPRRVKRPRAKKLLSEKEVAAREFLIKLQGGKAFEKLTGEKDVDRVNRIINSVKDAVSPIKGGKELSEQDAIDLTVQSALRASKEMRRQVQFLRKELVDIETDLFQNVYSDYSDKELDERVARAKKLSEGAESYSKAAIKLDDFFSEVRRVKTTKPDEDQRPYESFQDKMTAREVALDASKSYEEIVKLVKTIKKARTSSMEADRRAEESAKIKAKNEGIINTVKDSGTFKPKWYDKLAGGVVATAYSIGSIPYAVGSGLYDYGEALFYYWKGPEDFPATPDDTRIVKIFYTILSPIVAVGFGLPKKIWEHLQRTASVYAKTRDGLEERRILKEERSGTGRFDKSKETTEGPQSQKAEVAGLSTPRARGLSQENPAPSIPAAAAGPRVNASTTQERWRALTADSQSFVKPSPPPSPSTERPQLASPAKPVPGRALSMMADASLSASKDSMSTNNTISAAEFKKFQEKIIGGEQYKGCVVSHTSRGHLSLSGQPESICNTALAWVKFQKKPETQPLQSKPEAQAKPEAQDQPGFKISGKNQAKVKELFEAAERAGLRITTITILGNSAESNKTYSSADEFRKSFATPKTLTASTPPHDRPKTGH